MKNRNFFIAGDWGTSRLRLTLCDAGGRRLDVRSGRGIAATGANAPAAFEALSADWRAEYGDLPAVLCGMVGSNIGWTPVPYLPCPIELAALGSQLTKVPRLAAHAGGAPVWIVPGLSCRNVNDAPDVLRGEETQVLGALKLSEDLQQGEHLLCLPGTHTKWLHLQDGVVQTFLTAATGELFAAVRHHSVLIRAADNVQPQLDRFFEQGVAQALRHTDQGLLCLLFECRARQVSGEFSAAAALSFLSGLMIAAEVHGALRAFGGADAIRKLVLIGDARLTAPYAVACTAHRLQTSQIDGATAVWAGLASLYAQLD